MLSLSTSPGNPTSKTTVDCGGLTRTAAAAAPNGVLGPAIISLAPVIAALRGHDRRAAFADVVNVRVHVEEQPMIERPFRGIRIIHDQGQALGFLRHLFEVQWRAFVRAIA